MPLTGYHLIGLDGGPISFDRHDIELIKRSEERTEKFLARSPYKFNLFFHNAVWKGGRGEEGKETWLLLGSRKHPHHMSDMEPDMWEDVFLSGYQLDSNAINIVYTGNATSAPEMPMTPHIMMHRLGHAHNVWRSTDPDISSTLVKWGSSIVSSVYGISAPDVDLYAWGDNPKIESLRLNAIFKTITTTRCGRTNSVNGYEYIPEWLAQYINIGSVKFPKFAPETIDLSIVYENDRGLKAPAPIEIMRAQQEYSLRDFQVVIEKSFEQYLDGLVGDIFVT